MVGLVAVTSAPMTDLAALLTVQQLDNSVGALRHRRSTLPERKALDEATAQVSTLSTELADRDAPRRDLEREQRRLEGEAELLRAKAASENQRLYSGSVTAVRELQAIQEEISSLQRRSGQLDEQTIELMMRIEPLVDSVADLRARLDAAEAVADRATVALAEAEVTVNGELAATVAQRAAAAADVPVEAMQRYEAARPQLAPSTVVRLVGTRCEGCPLQMPSVEADRIRHLEAGLADCDECGRLVLH